MSTIKSLLLWEKWRPKTLEEVVLLPRIRKQFEKCRKYLEQGIQLNFQQKRLS